MKNLLPKREENSNKGTFGTVLNVAGCNKYRGAAYLSSCAALKVGAGKVVLASQERVLDSIAEKCPEIILQLRKDVKSLNDYSSVVLGCGLSTDRSAKQIFKKILNLTQNVNLPLVIDADGLNILSEENLKLNKNTILTPHPKEMARLMGVEVGEILKESEKWVKKCSEKYNCVAVLKMHKTLVCFENNFYENNSGNSALAKAGTGDVLAGMIGGFLAQGMSCFDAAKLSVYLHGRAGELASFDLSEYGVLASDVLKYIPVAIKKLLEE